MNAKSQYPHDILAQIDTLATSNNAQPLLVVAALLLAELRELNSYMDHLQVMITNTLNEHPAMQDPL